jgi:hypothetical protein
VRAPISSGQSYPHSSTLSAQSRSPSGSPSYTLEYQDRSLSPPANTAAYSGGMASTLPDFDSHRATSPAYQHSLPPLARALSYSNSSSIEDTRSSFAARSPPHAASPASLSYHATPSLRGDDYTPQQAHSQQQFATLQPSANPLLSHYSSYSSQYPHYDRQSTSTNNGSPSFSYERPNLAHHRRATEPHLMPSYSAPPSQTSFMGGNSHFNNGAGSIYSYGAGAPPSGLPLQRGQTSATGFESVYTPGDGAHSWNNTPSRRAEDTRASYPVNIGLGSPPEQVNTSSPVQTTPSASSLSPTDHRLSPTITTLPQHPHQHDSNSAEGSSPSTEIGSPLPTAAAVSSSAPSQLQAKTYSFVSLPGNTVKKRPRRRYDEIERLYSCSFVGCTKAYGTLNHLNAHVSMQRHGPKRSPSGKLLSCVLVSLDVFLRC